MSTTLLLADDSPTIAKILGMALQTEPYAIRSVLTAGEALKELTSNPPDFFLVDLNLPEKNGYEFAKVVRGDTRLSGKVRVLLLSSAFEPADPAAVTASGADGVIAKPFDPAELRAKLRELRDAPPQFPAGSHVSGSLSGQSVVDADAPPPAPAPISLANEGGALEISIGDDLPPAAPGAQDQDAMLSALLNRGSEASEGPDPSSLLGSDLPPLSPIEKVEAAPSAHSEFTNATVLLDLSGSAPAYTPDEPILDLTNNTKSLQTSLTAMIDDPRPAASLPTATEDAPPAAPPSSPPAAAPEPNLELSPNATALAAFFSAEIAAGAAPKSFPGISADPAPTSETPPPAPAPEEDSFDASLSSIDWGDSADAQLGDWTNSKPAAPSEPVAEAPPPAPAPAAAAPTPAAAPFTAPKAERPAPRPAASTPAPTPSPSPAPVAAHQGAATGGAPSSFLFDTADSNFRFAPDYVQRITKSFSGAMDEMILGKDPSPPVEEFFPKASDDRPRARMGGGAWSPEEMGRIEQLVKEEVQMVVREIAEKVAWEVIPELAENLIRKELDKVLKEMEQQ